MQKRLGMDSILREEKFAPGSVVKSLTSFLTSFLRCHKDIANVAGYFGHPWPNPSKIILSICKRLSCLSTCKTSAPQLNSFLSYCKRHCILILSTFGISGHTQQK